MERYVFTKQYRRAHLSLGLIEERAEAWQRKARDLRIRRERRIKQQLHGQR